MEFSKSLNFSASVQLIEMEVRMSTSLGVHKNPTQHKITHFKVWSSGLVFSGDPETKKYFSICNTLPLNKLNDSHYYTNLILMLHTPSPSLHFLPENCLQVGYFSSCPKSNKSEIYQAEECLRVKKALQRKPCPLSMFPLEQRCFVLNLSQYVNLK